MTHEIQSEALPISAFLRLPSRDPVILKIFQPMPLLKRATAFDDPDCIYELKMDGFRALAIVERSRAQLLSLVKHSVSSSCSDLHICLLPLLLHSPISTRLDCSAGLFSFRYGRNKLSYCPISSLLLKIRFCQKSVLLIIGVKISSHDSPCVVDSEWECG